MMAGEYLDLVRSVVEMLSQDETTLDAIIEGARVRDEVPFAVMRAKRTIETLIEDVGNFVSSVETPEARRVLRELVEDLNKALKELEECQKNSEKCYSGNEVDMECVDCHYEVLSEVTDDLIHGAKTELKKISHSLKKKSEGGALIKSKHEEYKNAHAEAKKLMEFIKSLDEYSNELNAISMVFDNVSGSSIAPAEIDDKAIFILKLLLELAESGAYVGEVLSALTGLKSVTADPVDKEVKIDLPSKDRMKDSEEHSLPLQTLFYRYPPFEPISLEDENSVSGSRVWFVKIKNIAYYKHGPKMYVHPQSIKDLGFDPRNLIHDASLSNAYETTGAIYPEHIFKIKPVNVLEAKDGYIILAVSLDSRRQERVYIKYGSEFLKRAVKRNLNRSAIRDLYINELRKKGHRGKTYEPTDLTYAWYCTSGYGLSTDPLDVRCPFKGWCKYGNECGGRKWKRTRRIFPKVFLDVERSYSGIDNTNGFFSPIVGRNVLIEEKYPSAHLSMPESGLPVVFKFKVPFRRSLPKTNVIGFRIAPEFLELVVRTVLDEKALQSPELGKVLKYELWKGGPEVKLGDVLLTKFFIYDKAEKGFKTYDLLRRRSKSLIESYLRMRENLLVKSMPYNRLYFKRFLRWASEAILHSLAHAFLSYVSVELQIETSNLVYLYDERAGLVLVAENSPIGSIDIIGALNEWCRSKGIAENCYGRFIEEFLRRELRFLRDHEEDTVQYADRVKSVVSSVSGENDLEGLRKAIIELYKEFLEKGLVLDVHSLSTHLLLSSAGQSNLERLIEEKGLSVDTQKAHRYFDDVLLTAIPNYCVDGCTTCVVIDRGCTAGLGQTYTVSRKLMEFAIGVLLGEYPLRGPGGSYLKKLLGIARESVEAMSPYLDDEGIETLVELVEKGIHVKLSTRPEFVREYGEKLREAGIEVTEVRGEHDKWYCLDGWLLIKPTANMNLESESYNSFVIKLGGCK
ncbi:hypothetical protein [Thermococcus sp. MV11]|uniref:hypothetical protein n=1 Tax=Thermococcus sp. MV11 TaxID=1638267 RepID=UPI001431F9C3|nr:hypothetical protein [Thermococcus sp. MV11]NJE02754.1 hypothetical protein [Thermococcus sp. MV11]